MIKHFTENVNGKDYVVGDIHGCFEKLERQLNEIGFDPEKDRLFSTGDLVDRGPSSEKALDWLAKPWFHAVRGNHEQMAIDYVNGDGDRYLYAYNGGQWFIDICDVDERVGKQFAQKFAEMPLAIDITLNNGDKYGIIHADCPTHSWNELEAVLKIENTDIYKNFAMWSRDRFDYKEEELVQDVDVVYVGHTPVREVLTLGNIIHIDTGACFGGKLTIMEIY